MLSSQTIIPQIDTLSHDISTPAAKLGWYTYLLQDYVSGAITSDQLFELLDATSD